MKKMNQANLNQKVKEKQLNNNQLIEIETELNKAADELKESSINLKLQW